MHSLSSYTQCIGISSLNNKEKKKKEKGFGLDVVSSRRRALKSRQDSLLLIFCVFEVDELKQKGGSVN